jgi:hypothetical protein
MSVTIDTQLDLARGLYIDGAWQEASDGGTPPGVC